MTSAVLLSFMWLTFLAMVVLEVHRRSPALLFVGGAILTTAIPISVHLFTGRYDSIVWHQAVLYIAAFNALFFVTRLVLRGQRVVPNHLRDPGAPLSPPERRLLAIVIVMFAIPFFVKLAEHGFSVHSIAASAWREGRIVWRQATTFPAHASFGLVLCLVFLRRYALSAVALLAVILLVFADRSRATGLAAIAPLLLFLTFRGLENRVRPVRLAATLGAFALAIVGFFLVQQVRYLGPLAAVATTDPQFLLGAATGRIADFQGDLSLVDLLVWLMTNGQSVDGYGEMSTLRRMLTFPFPGGLKPPALTHSIATAVRGGQSGTSLHPTIYGLTWADAQWFGIPYAVLIAGIMRTLDRIIVRFGRGIAWTFLLGPYSVFALLAARGSLYNGWVAMLVTTAILLMLIHLSLRVTFQARSGVLGRTASFRKRSSS